MLAEIIGPDMLIIVLLVVVLFGGSRIPGLARSLGAAKSEFEKGRAGSDEPVPTSAGAAAEKTAEDATASTTEPTAFDIGTGIRQLTSLTETVRRELHSALTLHDDRPAPTTPPAPAAATTAAPNTASNDAPTAAPNTAPNDTAGAKPDAQPTPGDSPESGTSFL